MTDLQIGIYFIVGIMTVILCALLNKIKLLRLIQNAIIVLLALAILYTIFSFLYFVFMKQLGPGMLGSFMLGLHKIVICYVDGIIIGYFLTQPVFSSKTPDLLTSKSQQLYNLFRYLMAAYFICTGCSKIIGFSGILGFFQLSGYSVLFLYFIIVFEIIFGLALLFKRTAAIGALVLIVEMAGATFTHYHNNFEHHIPEPFSNSLDSLKMLPFLLVIALIYNTNRKFKQYKIT